MVTQYDTTYVKILILCIDIFITKIYIRVGRIHKYLKVLITPGMKEKDEGSLQLYL